MSGVDHCLHQVIAYETVGKRLYRIWCSDCGEADPVEQRTRAWKRPQTKQHRCRAKTLALPWGGGANQHLPSSGS